MTIHTALLQGKQLLEQADISAPRLTAEVLLSHAIGCERQWLVAHSTDELKEVWWIHYGRYLHERLKGRPTQQITGRQEFYGREFRVTADVLIPRPETEHVVEAVLLVLGALENKRTLRSLPVAAHGGLAAHAMSRDREGAEWTATRSTLWSPLRILDLGTGSGAIGITLALETNAHVIATDLSPQALRIARDNARSLQADVQWVQGDLSSAFASESFDMVVSNPPYIATSDKPTLQREVRDFEPELALYGGEDGLGIYRRLIPEAQRILKPGGWLVLEIGSGQSDGIGAMLREWGSVEIRADLAGLPRVALAQRK